MAQKYVTALGFRLGTEAGLSVQQRLSKNISMEGIIQKSFRTKENGLIILLQDHNRIISRRFNVYYGAGPHWYFKRDSFSAWPSGLSLIGGFELTIGRANISYDFLPAFNFIGDDRIFDYQSALSIRWVIIKEKRRKWRVFKK